MITHLWAAMWPNVFAPSAWTIAAVGVSHLLHHRRQTRHHGEMLAHIARLMGGEA